MIFPDDELKLFCLVRWFQFLETYVRNCGKKEYKGDMAFVPFEF